MILGTALFSVGAAAIKMAGDAVPASQILFARGVVGLCFCLTMMRRAGIAHLGRRSNRPILIARGLCGATSFLCMIYAFVHLPLADATVIIFLHPILVAILGAFVLREALPAAAWACIPASLAGVVLVTKPGLLFAHGHSLDQLGVIMAFASVFFSSLAILAVRRLAATEHPVTIMLYPLFVILVATPVVGVMEWRMPDLFHLGLILTAGVFMNAGQYYMTRGYALGTAATISAVGYLEIVFAAVWGVVLFGDVPDLLTVAGALLIVGSTWLLGRARQTG